ncbi:MAG: hypothetical protein JO257_17155 [Deltaproteobacteria bacterium]|nr:hypothetical protein [Deltaproteobacteria bacterium]
MERRFAVHARAHALIAVVLASSSVLAAPKGGSAKKEFDRGVKAYDAGDFDAAVDAMSKSYGLEKDPETLFAWAQAERKLDNCDKAIELYKELLGFDLPPENKQVIQQNLGECKQLVADKKKGGHAEPAQPDATPPPDVDKADAAGPPPPTTAATPASAPVTATSEPTTDASEDRAWWKDPVGDGLVLVGIGGLAFGGVELMNASKADSDKRKATSYADFKQLEKKAHDDGELGVIAAGAGGGLIVLGVIWYAMHREHHEHQVTGWIAPTGGGGIALTGGF